MRALAVAFLTLGALCAIGFAAESAISRGAGHHPRRGTNHAARAVGKLHRLGEDQYPFSWRAPSRVTGSIVTFEPGARTNWHTHPVGQTLIVLSGSGWVQREGAAKQPIKAGDFVWTPPGVKHGMEPRRILR